ncbi:arginine biosynthesis bifunctional protein ArgJ [Spirochaetota bacterium]|nr:arginine biosynthesis bifunctional protein ArgJ [Spirochaetota bacterium]
MACDVITKKAVFRFIKLRTVAGYLWGGISAGLKNSGAKDLALVISEHNTSTEGMFTQHELPGAPIIIAQDHLARQFSPHSAVTRDKTIKDNSVIRGTSSIRALIINSGNANVFNGRQGLLDAYTMCQITAAELGLAKAEWVIPASTGLIGKRLPMHRIGRGIKRLRKTLGSSTEHIKDFAEAIMTTDRHPKYVCLEVKIGTKSATMVGIIKGAGMIEPNMATMLCYVISDLGASRQAHKAAFRSAIAQTLNTLSIDGDMSTSDMAISMLNHKSGLIVSQSVLKTAYLRVLGALGEQVLLAGEGKVRRVLYFTVAGVHSNRVADKIAKSMTRSLLVKTALAGGDANWGRIIMAIGKSGSITKNVKNHRKFDTTSIPTQKSAKSIKTTKIATNQEITASLEECLVMSFYDRSDYERFYGKYGHDTTFTANELATRIQSDLSNDRLEEMGTSKHRSIERLRAVHIRADKHPTLRETKRLKQLFARKRVYLVINLNNGQHHKSFAMTDLNEAYVKFNSTYST